MGLTLVEAAKLASGDVIKSAVIEMFARESDILMALSFENIAGNAVKYNREFALPGIGFRGINEAYTESTGILNPQVESLVIAGGDLDVDRFIVTTMGAEQRATQEAMKVKALADTWTTKFVKGDSSTQPREFDGLQARLGGNQLIPAGTTSGGSPLSLNTLDQGIDAVDSPTHILMGKAMRRRLSAAARDTTVGGYISYNPDAFGRRQMYYNDLPILVAYNNNGGTEVLPFTEATWTGSSYAGTATGTSIYVLSIGDNRLTGIQNGVMDVRDLGELQAQPVYRTRVEWYAGIALYHGRAAARISSISDAAIVK